MKKHLFIKLSLLLLLVIWNTHAWAATSTTLYYAISSSDVGSYTVKYNVKLQGDKDNLNKAGSKNACLLQGKRRGDIDDESIDLEI